MIFKCDFGGGVACDMEVCDTPPKPGEKHIRGVRWSGKPTRDTIRPYIAWTNSVNKQLADRWNLVLVHAFLLSPSKAQIWIYRPGEEPKPIRVKP